jgi:polyphosphate kinase
MDPSHLLEKATHLLHEVARETHAVPLRLRALNMLTYALDVVFIHDVPRLLQEAHHSGEAIAVVRQLAQTSAEMLNQANDTLRRTIIPRIEARGLHLRAVDALPAEQRAGMAALFRARVRPLLTPLAVDAGRPFPQISTHSLNLLAVIEHANQFEVEMPSFARLKLPRKVPRLIELTAQPPSGDGASTIERTFVLSEDMVRACIDMVFPGMQVAGVHQFRILRGASADYTEPVGRHAALARQKAWPVVRIDVEPDMPEWVLRWLLENMEAQDAAVLHRVRPLGIGTLAAEWADRITVPAAGCTDPEWTAGTVGAS